MRVRSLILGLALRASLGALIAGPVLDDSTGQLIVSIAADWDAPRGKLQRFDRVGDGWKPASAAIPVLYGKSGLAWGRGVAGDDEEGARKREGDGRAPAGLFALGTIYGEDPALPQGAVYPYYQVTARDAWIDDPAHPLYNQHVVIEDPAHPPEWFEKHRMRLGDAAFRWRVEIRHNADPPVAGAGSAIFFHIRRGPDRKTAGCTVMAQDELLAMIRWLRAERLPHYVLLPWAEYKRRAESWGLPPLEVVKDLAP